MEFSFNSEIAAQVGVNAAVLFKNLSFWIQKNIVNKAHVHDGNVWTYNSMKAFAELFPFMTERQIRTALEKLKEADLIVTGNYNEAKMDRTCWYALTEKGLKCAELTLSDDIKNACDESLESQEHLTEKSVTFDQKVEAIPDIKPDSKLLNPPIVPPTEGTPFPQKEKEIFTYLEMSEKIIGYLNERLGTRYQASGRKTVRTIKARLAEGFTLDDFKAVIDKKCTEWEHDAKMCVYLRPETLFGTKFESYLNQKTANESGCKYDFSAYD